MSEGVCVVAGGGRFLFTGDGLALHPQHGEFAAAGIPVGMVTIAGTVAPNTAFCPDRIAERFWALHTQPRSAWAPEVVFDGEG